MQSRNKDFMETIFEVSIQPTAGHLVNCHLSNHEVSKLYCNHMKQKFCHLLFTLANVRGALELGSGRNPDFSEFRFLPEVIKKPWPEPELCPFQRDRISSLFIE